MRKTGTTNNEDISHWSPMRCGISMSKISRQTKWYSGSTSINQQLVQTSLLGGIDYAEYRRQVVLANMNPLSESQFNKYSPALWNTCTETFLTLQSSCVAKHVQLLHRAKFGGTRQLIDLTHRNRHIHSSVLFDHNPFAIDHLVFRRVHNCDMFTVTGTKLKLNVQPGGRLRKHQRPATSHIVPVQVVEAATLFNTRSKRCLTLIVFIHQNEHSSLVIDENVGACESAAHKSQESSNFQTRPKVRYRTWSLKPISVRLTFRTTTVAVTVRHKWVNHRKRLSSRWPMNSLTIFHHRPSTSHRTALLWPFDDLFTGTGIYGTAENPSTRQDHVNHHFPTSTPPLGLARTSG